MKKTRLILLTLASTLTLLCGCSKEKEMPEDNPANHGQLAIMETENGYYYNFGYAVPYTGEDANLTMRLPKHLLRYSDKETGETILVCNKPECEHNRGADCSATYKDITIINSIMYNDEIYVYGIEEDDIIIRFNLYRIAPDGSSIDKVGTAFECENTLRESYATALNLVGALPECFIIHKGYAYLPYYMRIGIASRGFMGGGLVQIDITTGKVNSIYEMEYMTSEAPTNLRAYDDHVYMDMKGIHSYGGTTRYIISEDRLEQPNSNYKLTYGFPAGERLYNVFHAYDGNTMEPLPISIEAFDRNTGIWLTDESFQTDIIVDMGDTLVSFPYEDMVVIGTDDRVVFYSLREEKYGDKIGELFIESGERVNVYPFEKTMDFKIHNDILYCICTPIVTEENKPDFRVEDYYTPYEVFCCPVEDVLNGTGQWEKAFSYEKGR